MVYLAAVLALSDRLARNNLIALGSLMKLQKLENVATQATKKITTADIADERNRRLLIECYKEWLATHTRRNTINNALPERENPNEYQ
jgi:hypothetical protein